MKRISAFLLSLILTFVFCGCSKASSKKAEQKEEPGYINGVWISYIEIDGMIKNGGFEKNFTEVITQCKKLKITDIFLHTVPFCDVYYKSKIYPLRNADILDIAVEKSHKAGIRLHAWINPYRVKTKDNTLEGTEQNALVYKWACDPECHNVLYTESGVYLNPAEAETRKTVIDAVREICLNHKVDGIHLDDYFYPTTDSSFDAESYLEYANNTENPLSQAEYRTASVNALISGLYTAVKFIDKDIIFSISPAADIDKNLKNYSADVKSWCENGCLDIIIPQIYFGFSYPTEKFCFENLLYEWEDLVENTETKLCIGLAPYKIGTEKKPDCEEWQSCDDIISRQTEICINDDKVSGNVFYSYSSLFGKNEQNVKSLEKLSAVLDSLS